MTKRSGIDDLNRAFKQRQERNLHAVNPAVNPAVKTATTHMPSAAELMALQRLTSTDELPSTMPLPATKQLPSTAKRKDPPSWRVPKLTIRLDRQKLEKMRLLSVMHGRSIQDLVLTAIDSLMATSGLPSTPDAAVNGLVDGNRQVAALTAPIDKDDLIDDAIVSHYEKWTGNRFGSDSDLKAYRSVQHYHPLVIQAGVLLSVWRTKTRVNSFAYCVGAISEVAESGIKDSLKTHVKRLEAAVTQRIKT